MKPIIVRYDCTDHDPIETWIPDDPFNVDFWMNFTIGPDMKGGDNFQVRVTTPNNLHGRNADKHAIVLAEYSWASVLEVIEKLLEDIRGDDWAEVSAQLSQLMFWEYENYKPYKGA